MQQKIIEIFDVFHILLQYRRVQNPFSVFYREKNNSYLISFYSKINYQPQP